MIVVVHRVLLLLLLLLFMCSWFCPMFIRIPRETQWKVLDYHSSEGSNTVQWIILSNRCRNHAIEWLTRSALPRTVPNSGICLCHRSRRDRLLRCDIGDYPCTRDLSVECSMKKVIVLRSPILGESSETSTYCIGIGSQTNPRNKSIECRFHNPLVDRCHDYCRDWSNMSMQN